MSDQERVHTTSFTTLDYRNARYQGSSSQNHLKQGPGILVDDDLSFYASDWQNDMLNGPTLVYIAHGKYIYGEWANNELNGLNVLRTGDTVMVANYLKGALSGRLIVIFEKYNMIAVLETELHSDEFNIISCGTLLDHSDLQKYVKLLNYSMPEHYFSLIKFVTFLTDHFDKAQDSDDYCSSIVTSPCEQQYCYFGYRDQGLGIVFNSNNGVVSVGWHSQMKLNGLGGRFDGQMVEEGNFETGETLQYQKKRPENNIYALYQKMHKRSLNFKNYYFDSKIKTLGSLQIILRKNINKIVKYNVKNKINSSATADNLNDSLDYTQKAEQEVDLEKERQLEENRYNLYHQQPKLEKKTVSQYERDEPQPYNYQRSSVHSYNRNPSENSQASRVSESSSKGVFSKISAYTESEGSYTVEENTVRKTTPSKVIHSGNSCVSYAKKSPFRQTRLNQQKRQFALESSAINSQSEEETYSRSQRLPTFQRNHSRSPLNSRGNRVEPNKISEPLIVPEQQAAEHIPQFKGGMPSKKLPAFKQANENTPIRGNHIVKNIKSQIEEYKRQLEKSRSIDRTSQSRSISKVLKRPNYEDIEERRKRILNQFKELNPSNGSSRIESHNVSDLSQRKRRNYRQQNGQSIERAQRNQTTKYEKSSIHTEENFSEGQTINNEVESEKSPCRRNLISCTSEMDNGTENSNQGAGFIPISMAHHQQSMEIQSHSDHRPALRNRRLLDNYPQPSSAFSKKQSFIDKLGQKYSGTASDMIRTPSRRLQERKPVGWFDANQQQSNTTAYKKYPYQAPAGLRRNYSQIDQQQQQPFKDIKLQKESVSNKENILEDKVDYANDVIESKVSSHSNVSVTGRSAVSKRKNTYKYYYE